MHEPLHVAATPALPGSDISVRELNEGKSMRGTTVTTNIKQPRGPTGHEQVCYKQQVYVR